MRTHASTPGTRATFTYLIESFFVRYRAYFPYWHATMCLICLLFVVGPVLLSDPPKGATPFTHFTTFSQYLIWGLWFPFLFVSVIFTGRAWCGLLCPMGAASEWVNKVGLKRPIPKWLRWEGVPITSFIVITILCQVIEIEENPAAAAKIFGSLLAAALLIGFLYGRKKRAWCRHMCPIGLLLGLYSRVSIVNFAPKMNLLGKESYTEKGICPTMISLAHKKESRHCIECFRCVNPKAKWSMRIEFRRPGTEIERIRDHQANPYEVWALFLIAGLTLGEFLRETLTKYQTVHEAVGAWAASHVWEWMPQAKPAWLAGVHSDRIAALFGLDFYIAIPMLTCMLVLTASFAIMNGAAAYLSFLAGGNGTFSERFTELGYQYVPVTLISLVLGLGDILFNTFQGTLEESPGILAIKGTLLLAGVMWSGWLSACILARQGVRAFHSWLPLIPCVAGNIAMGLVWWTAVFSI